MFKICETNEKREKKTGAKYIKNKREVIKIKKKEILGKWKCYFEDLLNKENEFT